MADYIDFAKNLCLESGKIIRDGYYCEKAVTAKAVADFVTEYDVMVETLVFERISAAYPSHCFIGEETTDGGKPCGLTEEPTWIVDPIDGTSNFISRFPYCCISLALYVDKQPVVGVVYNPILDDMYSAVQGAGAYLNGTKISVTSSKDLSECLVIAGWGSDRDEVNVKVKSQNMVNLLQKCRGLRSLGSAAMSMCFLACGHVDIYIEQAIKCWDMAAGALIITEAGGIISNLDGGVFDIMTHGVICAPCRPLMTQVAHLITVIDY